MSFNFHPFQIVECVIYPHNISLHLRTPYKVKTEDGVDEELLLLHQPRQGRRLRLRRVPRDLGHRFRHSVHRRVPAGNHKQVKSHFRWVGSLDSFHIKQ